MSFLCYMRDNHTFRVLPHDIDGAVAGVLEEVAAGWTSGSLFIRYPGGRDCSLPLSYRMTRDEVEASIRNWLPRVLPVEGFTPRLGALRYADADTGKWHCANPGDLTFSTVTMLATQVFDENGWKDIYNKDDL